MQQRVTETTEAHNKLQSHLSKTMQEIYDQVKKFQFCGEFNGLYFLQYFVRIQRMPPIFGTIYLPI